MSTAQHTPGPLHLDSEAETVEGCRTIHAADGTEIACTSGLHDDDEDLANARLFAAAPDFLAWAQKHAYETHRGTLMLDIVDVIELQNIVAKATGAAA